MSKSRRKKVAASAEPSSAPPAPPSGAPTELPAPPARRNGASVEAFGAPLGSNRFAAIATPDGDDLDDDDDDDDDDARLETHAVSSSSVPNGTTGPRRRRRDGGAAGQGRSAAAPAEPSSDAVQPPAAVPTRGGHPAAAPGTSSAKQAASGKAPLRNPSPDTHDHTRGGGGGGGGGAGRGGGGGGTRTIGRRRRRLWRVLQWPLAVLAVILAYAAVPRRLIEEAPLTVSELLHDGLLGLGPLARLNVTLPPLPLQLLPLLNLPKPSLDAIIASTGFNVSSLIGLTDTLTDTLNDLSDTLSAARLTVTVRGLLAQLPAFGLPGQLGAGGGGASAGGAGNGSTDTSGLRPGLVMARRGYRAKHPVVIVPGFVTSGLELWQGLTCGQRYFRQRMWGTLAMVQAFLTDPACWFRHMELDPVTGLDPAGIKLRAAVGLEAVDYFIQGYWVWGKLVEALADVGYDSNSLVSMPYDWRLAMPLLEERDGYFTRLRLAIEALAGVNGERVVITAHSYGENVVRAFMTWVEADRPGWVDEHVHAVVNIAGTSLGVPKSISALLSGETRDTAQLGALAGFLTSNLVPRATRTRVWRTWGASYAMLPVGGPRVWGNASWAPDDTPEMRAERRTYGAMVSLWPHDWETVLAAAAAAAPQQREELRRLVHQVSESSDTSQTSPAPASSSSSSEAGEAAAAAAVASATAATAAAASAAADDTATANRPAVEDGCSNRDSVDEAASGDSSSDSSSSSRTNCSYSSSSGGTGGSGSSSTMARLTDTLKRLVSSGGSDIDPKDFLDSEHITRLDVSGFLALLREVGGPVMETHMREWAAVDLSSGDAEAAAQEAAAGDAARRRATDGDGADGDGTAQARQSVGVTRRLRHSVRRRSRVALFPDATRTPLPNAPSTAIVCLYGVGIPTERGYHYLRPPPSPPLGTAAAAAGGGGGGGDGTASSSSKASVREDDSMGEAPRAAAAAAEAAAVGGDGGSGGGAAGEDGSAPLPPPRNASASGEEASTESGPDAGAGWMIMRDVSDPGSALDVGVQLTDGDGTVPLLSLGLMCRSGWRPGGRLNPAGMRVVTREYKHKSVSLLQDSRGGPANAAHIDILGNEAVMQDVIRVAAGRVDELDDVIHSSIDRIAAAVEF